jgi:hypothetical protein
MKHLSTHDRRHSRQLPVGSPVFVIFVEALMLATLLAVFMQ